MNEPRREQGRGTAVITGATGGIGSSYARQLAARGFDLLLVARTRSHLEALAVELSQRYGVSAEPLRADLVSEPDLRLLEQRLGGEPPLELLVNNAGFGSWGRFAELDIAAEEALTRLNMLAPLRLARAVLPGMLRRQRGAVINVSSFAALMPQPYGATYCGTKALILNFSEALHEEVRGQGVTVQVVLPGFVRTGILEKIGVDSRKIGSWWWLEPDDVVRSSLKALDARRAVCIPSLRYRLLAWLLRASPRAGVRRVAALIFGRFDYLRLKSQVETSPPT